ncbi:Hypothetical protein GbCGDNIH6_1333 [Granulibacter bethesdensis]|nr:Hypothetical protein GbCGDNIH6_1333 [Granulibacter bethesdensis]
MLDSFMEAADFSANILAQWPNIVIIGIFCGALVIAQYLVQFLAKRIFPPTVLAEYNLSALDTFRVLGPLAGVFISFSLVQGIAEYRATGRQISLEATDAYQLDRALAGTDLGDKATPARLALSAYIQSVVTDEWRGLREGKTEASVTSQTMQALQEEVESLVNQLPPSMRVANDIDKNFDDLQDDRAKRLAVVRGGLPSIMWWVLGMLLLLLLICSAFLARPNRIYIHPLPTLFMAGLGIMSGLLFIIDRPYQGELCVSPAPLVKVLKQLNMRLHIDHTG